MQSKLLILRKNQKISQKKISELLEISQRQYSKKEQGISDFKSSEMFKIKEIFNLPIEDIFLPPLYDNGTKKETTE